MPPWFIPPFWEIVELDRLEVVKLAIAKEPKPIVPVTIAIDAINRVLVFITYKNNSSFDITTILAGLDEIKMKWLEPRFHVNFI